MQRPSSRRQHPNAIDGLCPVLAIRNLDRLRDTKLRQHKAAVLFFSPPAENVFVVDVNPVRMNASLCNVVRRWQALGGALYAALCAIDQDAANPVGHHLTHHIGGKNVQAAALAINVFGQLHQPCRNVIGQLHLL